MKYLFIMNPVAGGKKNKSELLSASIQELMDNSGREYEIYRKRN